MNNGYSQIKAVRVLNAQSAGTTTLTTSVLDRADCRGIKYVVLLGTLTSTNETTVSVQHGDQSDGSDMATVATLDATVDTDDNKLVVADHINSTKRYSRLSIARATANAVVDGVVALKYGLKQEPPASQDSTVAVSGLAAVS